ncbi:hypothetical protein CJ030_MR8G016487 [Morella rubra]|uniref:Uncharacterized protein n=1 Tax=Morella rubra TaxID=262757 RepID=A0A6A1USP5_9ROSI|nr:hypothetical protein CJ030_MR8G016479 [Morella rubra]KAB1203342.1 hypothetical protein CJ030_MR8G016487 [Morella rubra]
MGAANAPFMGSVGPSMHHMDVDDVTTNPTESEFSQHAMESETDILYIYPEHDQFHGHATEMETEVVITSQPAERSPKAAGRVSSSQLATGIASRIRARQAERRASQRLRGNVSSGQPAREPIMVDLTIDEASQETRTGVRCAWGNPRARGSQIVSATVASRFKPRENSSRVVVPNIEQALKRIKDKQKKKLPVWQN